MAFDNSCTRRSYPGPTPKRCETQVFLASLGQVIRCSKAVDFGSLNMQFQHDWPKDKKYSSFNFLAWKLRKISLEWALWCASRGIDNFSLSQSLGSTAMESCPLAESKYVIFSRAERKTKKLPRSKLFLSMAFKHGLLQGSTFLSQYSCMTCAPLETSPLGELKYAISPG